MRATSTPANDLAVDIYALIVYLHKQCNNDLFEAVGSLELSLSPDQAAGPSGRLSGDLRSRRPPSSSHVSLPAASRLVDDLVRRGFVERNEDAEDRRMKRVRLTEDGSAVIRRLNAARFRGLCSSSRPSRPRSTTSSPPPFPG